MKKIFLFLVLNLILVLNSIDFKTPNEIIVKTKSKHEIRNTNKFGFSDFDNFFGRNSIKNVSEIFQNQYFLVSLENDVDWNVLEKKRFEEIEYVQPNFLNKMCNVVVDDELFSEQQLDLCNIPEAWEISKGENFVKIAVIDSGLDFEHQDLQKNIFINEDEIPGDLIDNDNNGFVDDWRGWDFCNAPELSNIALGDYLDPDNDATDENFHGTHVSGIIGAETDNSVGIAGINWNCKIIPIRAGFRTSYSGYLQDDDAAAAIIYAVDLGANIINISWGASNFSQIIADACQYAYENGTIIVASSGNEGSENIYYPARLQNTISVGSIDEDNSVSSFSNYGNNLDLVAPGSQIYSTYNSADPENIYKKLSGTSMSSPFVTAGIGLLLSLEPDLTFEEVRGRLVSTTEDIGNDGFDKYSGHGKLNIEKLLQVSDEPILEISSIGEDFYFMDSFDIFGTISAPDFSRYSLMYKKKENQEWKNISDHHSQPNYYHDQKFDDLIGRFEVAENLFQEGKYQLRLELVTESGSHFYKIAEINYDNSEPKFKNYQIQERFAEDSSNNLIYLEFDEKVELTIDVFDDSNIYQINSNFADSVQFVKIPAEIPNGIYSFNFKAKNSVGLEFNSPDFVEELVLEKEAINYSDFNFYDVGSSKIFSAKQVDFDGNGVKEFLGMDFENSAIGQVKSYEFSGNNIIEKYSFEEEFRPISIGKSINENFEILGSKLDKMYVYSNFSDSNNYPSIAVREFSSAYGGDFFDINSDGMDEIAIIQILDSSREIVIYERTSATTFEKLSSIENSTETDLINQFVPTIKYDDFDYDGKKSILAADIDGDIMLFENATGTGNEWEKILQKRLDIGNVYYLEKGDFNGDGNLDFCVGGFNSAQDSPNEEFWHFYVFSSTENNTFEIINEFYFEDYNSPNSILAKDFDNDGDKELIMNLTPSLYILDWQEDGMKPIFYTQTEGNYQLISDDNSENFLFSKAEDGEIKTFLASRNNFSGPEVPSFFEAKPIDESTAVLTWEIDETVDYYKIYRKNNESVICLDSVYNEAIYYDENLESHSFYSITAVNEDFSPSESENTYWLEVTSSEVPEVESLNMTGSNCLELVFNQKIDQNSFKNSNFEVNNNIGISRSVNILKNSRGMLLSFNEDFRNVSNYKLYLKNIQNENGLAFPEDSLSFNFVEDITKPEILSVTIVENDRLMISFSEFMDETSILNNENYNIIKPNDDKIPVINAQIDSTNLFIDLAEDLKRNSKPYFLEIKNVKDNFGNELANNSQLFDFYLTEMTSLDFVKVYPNPVYFKNESDKLIFSNLPTQLNGTLRIYNFNGQLVFKENLEGFSSYAFLGRNAHNQKLSSGIYFYILDYDSKMKKGKIGIYR